MVPVERMQMMKTLREETFQRVVGGRWIVGGTMACYCFYAVMLMSGHDRWKYQVSLSRRLSQFSGFLFNLPLPPYLRVGLYKTFGTLYGVNFSEAIQQDLNQFTTFNAFFTRELKESARPISAPLDETTLVSPCDGRVLSYGVVDEENSTI